MRRESYQSAPAHPVCHWRCRLTFRPVGLWGAVSRLKIMRDGPREVFIKQRWYKGNKKHTTKQGFNLFFLFTTPFLIESGTEPRSWVRAFVLKWKKKKWVSLNFLFRKNCLQSSLWGECTHLGLKMDGKNLEGLFLEHGFTDEFEHMKILFLKIEVIRRVVLKL